MILVTGHKWFVGWHLTRLLDEKWLKWIWFDLVDGQDIRDKYKLWTVFFENKIDIVIHLAALASPTKSMMFPDEYFSTNINWTQNLLECAKKYNINHFISFSSSSVYWDQKPPTPEDAPQNPTSIYAISKATGEMLIRASDVPYTIIRPFTLYWMNGRKDQVVYKWINLIKEWKPITIYWDANNKRWYTFIDDLVGAVVWLIGNKSAINNTFNLGWTEVVSIYQLSKIFEKAIERKLEIHHLPLLKWDVYENWADTSRANELLWYNPEERFEENIKEIIKKELWKTST